MIEGVKCLVQMRTDLFKMPIYESIALVVLPILFGLSIVSLHYTYMNDVTWMSVMILPYALGVSLITLIQKVIIFIASTSLFMNSFQIDQKDSITQLFNKTLLLHQEIREFRGFGIIYLIIGGLGLTTALLISLIAERQPYKKLFCITISSIGLMALGLSSYNSFFNVPTVEELQDKLGDCITSKSSLTTSLGEDDVCKWG